jgi:hypothetical protein
LDPDALGSHANGAVGVGRDQDVRYVMRDGVAVAQRERSVADRIDTAEHPGAEVLEVIADVGREQLVESIEQPVIDDVTVHREQLLDRESVFGRKRHQQFAPLQPDSDILFRVVGLHREPFVVLPVARRVVHARQARVDLDT